MKMFENNNQNHESTIIQNELISKSFLIVHKSLKNNFPDVVTIDRAEEIPYYSLILGEKYDFYSPLEQQNAGIKKN
ncbi:MAG: hypothetical protein K0R25_556 [Rickettsiaceae bacterium]|jgi:hypothetical protein|nr:hypothetical protein [Rickettsiaceae bacterium]